MNKTVALLELTGEESNFEDPDVRYTMRLAQQILLYQFPIVDTGGNVSNTLMLLDRYYNEGKRIFIGFNRSTMLEAVRSWFMNHPDTMGISLTSTATSLRTISNVIRLSPPGNTTINPYIKWISQYDRVFLLYEPDELAIRESVNVLDAYVSQSIPIDLSTKDGIHTLENTMKSIRSIASCSSTLIIPYFVSTMEIFQKIAYPYMVGVNIDIFEDISTQPPVFTCGPCIRVFRNRYYYMKSYIPMNPLLKYLMDISGDRFSLYAYDAVLVAKTLNESHKVSGISGATGKILLDKYNDRLNPLYEVYIFNGDTWKPVKIL